MRPKDSALGKLAAVAALGAGDRRLLYDYQMNFDDDSQMSCVEVPSYSYKNASQGKVKIPMYPAHLKLKNEEFLNRIGLKNGELITPDDLETDPRFDLILEWQDARLIRDERQKDAVVREMLRWLNDLHYKFYDSPKAYAGMYVLLPLRQTPFWMFLKNLFGLPAMDAHIPRTTLGIMAVLDELRKQDETYFKANGRPMTNAQLRQKLEDMRVLDLANYQQGKESHFHKHLHPKAV